MIVQAIGLLDDLDKELNTYAMRVREWYGWHFPEMTKIVSDNIAYAKVRLKEQEAKSGCDLGSKAMLRVRCLVRTCSMHAEFHACLAGSSSSMPVLDKLA